MKLKNHLSIGSTLFTHKGKQVLSSLNNLTFEEFMASIDTIPFETAVVIPQVVHRPDSISNIFYDTPNFDWLIMLVNNISDPFEGFNVGDVIKVPIL